MRCYKFRHHNSYCDLYHNCLKNRPAELKMLKILKIICVLLWGGSLLASKQTGGEHWLHIYLWIYSISQVMCLVYFCFAWNHAFYIDCQSIFLFFDSSFLFIVEFILFNSFPLIIVQFLLSNSSLLIVWSIFTTYFTSILYFFSYFALKQFFLLHSISTAIMAKKKPLHIVQTQEEC